MPAIRTRSASAGQYGSGSLTMDAMSGRIFLGRYEALHQLGEGGMGRALLARDRELNEPVVVKVMHAHLASRKESRQRFQSEIELMSQFKHPGAVNVLDASMDDPNGPCIIMEYIPGISLDRLLKENVRFTPTRIYRFVKQLCDVLQAAHDHGIIHRDLKPTNLMVLDGDTPSETIKVLDFGIAKLLESSAQDSTHENAESGVGTPGYMSPEQFRGAPADHRSDLYSLGAMLYQLVTGRLPFSGSSPIEILIEQATNPPPTFREMGISEAQAMRVEPVIRSALSIDPAGRPSSAQEFFELYEEVLIRPVAAAVEPAPAPANPIAETATVARMRAVMAESIAKHKLEAFIKDVGGKVLESSPGLLSVQLSVNRNALRTGNRRSFWSWLGLRPSHGLVRMELRMETTQVKERTFLEFTITLRPERDQPLPTNDQWKATCTIIVSSLKQFLMAETC